MEAEGSKPAGWQPLRGAPVTLACCDLQVRGRCQGLERADAAWLVGR
jgi:hypothetical protein